MATSTIMNPNSTAVIQNLKSITRVTDSATTGATGNIVLPYENDGLTFIVGAHASGQDVAFRTWVASSNGNWFLTMINPNTGETINNTGVNYRYFVVKLYRST